MSALPLPDNVFKLPKRRPKIIEKQAPPDQRKFAVVPMRAAVDTELHGFSMKVLVLLCSYANRAGITWVGQQRLADHLQVSKQQVARAMKQLRDRGHVEIMSKGFKGERANTVRIIYDTEIKAEDAIAIASNIEDVRPPEMVRKETKAMEEHFTEEQMAANRSRLKELLQGLNPKNHTTHQPVQIGAILMPKKTPKAPKKTPHIDNTQVVNEEAYIDNIIDTSGVVQTQKNIGIQEVLSLYEEIIKRRFSYVVKTTEEDLKAAEVLCEVGVTASDIDMALTEQRNLVEAADQILNARVAR